MSEIKNRSISDLIRIDDIPDWTDDELAQMFTEQLDLSIGEFVNQSMGGIDIPGIPQPKESAETLRGLFSSQNPFLPLLQRVKDAAKLSSEHPLWPLPDEIAHAIYMASIAAAELNCGEQISKLEREEFDEALERYSTTPWVSDSIQSLCRSTLKLHLR